jgi:hypothetical protein
MTMSSYQMLTEIGEEVDDHKGQIAPVCWQFRAFVVERKHLKIVKHTVAPSLSRLMYHNEHLHDGSCANLFGI